MHALARILGILWALPWTLVGLLVGGLGLLTGGKVRRRGRALEFHGGVISASLRRLPGVGSAAAMTLGHVIIGRSPDALDRCRKHEHVHVRQYERWGPFFIPAYLLASAWQWCRGRRAYLDNPFEVEAYRREGQP